MIAAVSESASSPWLDPDKILRSAAFFVGAILIVAGAKWVREQLAARRGHRLAVLVADKDNVAVAVEMASFVLAMVVGIVGSIFFVTETWWEQALELVGTGVIVLVALLVNDQLTSRIVLRGIDPNHETAENANLAVAIVRGASNVATAFPLGAALFHPSPLGERIVWALIGQVALVGMSLGYQALTRYDDIAEVKQKNVAAALPMAGILVAVGLVVAAGLRGDGSGWGADLASLGIDLVASGLLVLLLRWAGDKLLLPGSTFHEEIARDKNAGAGFIEAMSYVAGAVAVAYFLN
ncbi:MAG: DUF350 domain-containing protein [Deltaproteobacteria bacterium]|nr:DUF350 domain-containing protein [Deltaproteobacteria bacterium]